VVIRSIESTPEETDGVEFFSTVFKRLANDSSTNSLGSLPHRGCVRLE
jgi:hypothetical protein